MCVKSEDRVKGVTVKVLCGYMVTGTRVVVEVPDSEQYHGRMEGLCGNMDGEPEEQNALFTTWDEYGNAQAQAQCSGATSPMPEPCAAVSTFNNL